jgi:hypothetical protein
MLEEASNVHQFNIMYDVFCSMLIFDALTCKQKLMVPKQYTFHSFKDCWPMIAEASEDKQLLGLIGARLSDNLQGCLRSQECRGQVHCHIMRPGIASSPPRKVTCSQSITEACCL